MRRFFVCVCACLAMSSAAPAPAADAVGMIVDLIGRDDGGFQLAGLQHGMG